MTFFLQRQQGCGLRLSTILAQQLAFELFDPQAVRADRLLAGPRLGRHVEQQAIDHGLVLVGTAKAT